MSKVEIKVLEAGGETFEMYDDFIGEDYLELTITSLRVDDGEDYFFPDVLEGSMYDADKYIRHGQLNLTVEGTFIADMTDEQIEHMKENGLGFVFMYEDGDGGIFDLDSDIGLENDAILCTYDFEVRKL